MFFETKNLCFSYYKNPLCLKDISLKVNKGQKILCVASKDMGKTTLLRVLSSFDDSYFGQIFLDGKELKKIDDKEKNFSLLFSEPVVLKNKSIKENFDYFCEINNIEQIFDEEMLNLLKTYNIERNITDKMTKLSLFEKRKFAILRSLLKKPQILFLDDQFEKLSDDEFDQMKKIYKKLINDKNLTIILTAGEKTYRLLKDDFVFDKFYYLCYANLKEYKSAQEFENARENLDSIKFFDDFKKINIQLIYENGDYKLSNGEIDAALIDENFNNSLNKLKMENFEVYDCILVINKQLLNSTFSLNDYAEMLKNKKANLYAELGGEKLI